MAAEAAPVALLLPDPRNEVLHKAVDRNTDRALFVTKRALHVHARRGVPCCMPLHDKGSYINRLHVLTYTHLPNEASRRAVHCCLVEELLRELLLLGWEAGAFGGGGGGWPAAFAALERDDIKKAHHTPAGSGGLRGTALVLRDTRVGRSDLCALEALPLRREVRGTGYPTGWTLLSPNSMHPTEVKPGNGMLDVVKLATL